jgi:hypothetical protein
MDTEFFRRYFCYIMIQQNPNSSSFGVKTPYLVSKLLSFSLKI